MTGLINEATGNQGQMEAALKAGLETISLSQTVTFTQYRRVVLPADGFVFWVRKDLLSRSALVNTWTVNSIAPNQVAVVDESACVFQAKGSLHHTTVNKQDPDEAFSIHRMVFTSEEAINELGRIAPGTLYLAQTETERYAFSTSSMRYKQAGLYHYAGDAVYPTLATQVIDNPADLRLSDRVVSNSLPVWLGLNQLFPIYPGYLVPDNVRPPYGVIDIDEADTTPLQAGAWHDRYGNRWQLAKDTVRVVTFGVRNNTIMDWLDLVTQYTLDNPSVMGVMNSPVPRDAKRGQVEISALAQKKTIVFDVSYYQSRMEGVARQLIRSAFIEDFIVPPPTGSDEGIGYFIIGESAIGEPQASLA